MLETYQKIALAAGFALALQAADSPAQEIGDPSCDRLLLISAYSANNVKIYDACDGTFIRNLDSNGTLAGPQAIAIDPQGDLVVVSETNGRLVRYHRGTLTYDRVIAGDRPETSAVERAPVMNPTGLVISPEGRMLVGSYSGHAVTEINPEDGTAMDHWVTRAGSGIEGPDTGMWLDGSQLLVPGFDSSTVVVADIDQPGSERELIMPGSDGLNAPRTVLKRDNGNILVTSWRGNRVLEYTPSGGFVRVVTAGVNRPTGMAFETQDVLLVASDATNDVSRVRISDGAVLDKFITFNPGLLSGPTFILVLEKEAAALSASRAFWLIGVGEIRDRRILVDQMFFASGGAFGSAFDPDDISNVPWGGLAIEFTGCQQGDVGWSSDHAGFDPGAYPIFRLADDPFGDDCEATGFDAVERPDWMSGLWFGGPSRNGEGFSVNVINGARAVVTWYTYLPAQSGS